MKNRIFYLISLLVFLYSAGEVLTWLVFESYFEEVNKFIVYIIVAFISYVSSHLLFYFKEKNKKEFEGAKDFTSKPRIKYGAYALIFVCFWFMVYISWVLITAHNNGVI